MKKFLQKNWLLIAAIFYLILPIDFIPESLFGPLGLTDDVGVLVIELVRRYFSSRRESLPEKT